MSVAWGSHMAMRTVIERNIMAQVQRPGGVGSSNFGLNSHMGRYDVIDFADTLGDPMENPEMDKDSIHTKLEKVYGMWANYWFNLFMLVNCKLKQKKKVS